MNWLPALLIVLPTMVPPLSENQQIVLEDTDDRSSTIDAAGLYALLDNAKTWPTDAMVIEPGKRLIDFAALRESPQTWRGEPWILEGALESISDAALYTPDRLLTRPDWKDLKVWHIRGPNNEIYVVCLTDPPVVPIQETISGHGIPEHVEQPVRVVGRFYKLVTVANHGGEPRRYAVFVGRTGRFLDLPARQAQPTGSANPLVGPGAMLIVLLIGAYWLIRITLKRKIRPTRRRYEEPDREEDEPVEYRTDLPDDPVAALDALEQETEKHERE